MALPNDAIRMTVDEFLNWDPADGRAWQLVDGEPRAMAPTNRTHGALLAELAARIGNHLRDARPDCSVVIAPGVVPRLMSAYNMRVPDLAVTCTPYRDEERALSNPMLLV
jgi:Uma2 family endonuclease